MIRSTKWTHYSLIVSVTFVVTLLIFSFNNLVNAQNKKEHDFSYAKHYIVLKKDGDVKAKKQEGKFGFYNSEKSNMKLERHLIRSKNEFDQLKSDSTVEAIQEDKLNFVDLDSSLPVIGDTTLINEGFDASNVTIAVLDTGVDSTHSFLNVTGGACFSNAGGLGDGIPLCPGGVTEDSTIASAVPCTLANCDHGTHVAGIAAGGTGGASGQYHGAGKGADIIAIQVFTEFNDTATCGVGNTPCMAAYDSDIARALDYLSTISLTLTKPLVSVNMSLGGGDLYTDQASCDSDNSVMKASLDTLYGLDIPSFVATGNGASRDGISAPACISSAYAVSASTDSDAVASYSNVGSLQDFFMPGSSITSSTIGDGNFVSKSGTSMATPMATGSYAMVKANTTSKSMSQVIQAFNDTGTLIADTRSGGLYAKNRMNVDDALNKLRDMAPTTVASPADPFSVDPNASTLLTFTITDDIKVLTSDVTLDTATTISNSGFLCVQTSTQVVTCSITVTGRGLLRIDSIDSQANASHFDWSNLDTTAPILQSFSTTTTDGTYGPGSTIHLIAQFNENLSSDSIMTVLLNNSKSLILSNVSGSTLSGDYIVGITGSHEDITTLDVQSISSLIVKDSDSNQSVSTTLPGVNITGATQIAIDTTSINVSSNTITSNSGLENFATTGNTITFTVSLNETPALMPTVSIMGHSIIPTQSLNSFSATYILSSLDTGPLQFSFSSSDGAGNLTVITQNTFASPIIINTIASPATTPTLFPVSGTGELFTNIQSSFVGSEQQLKLQDSNLFNGVLSSTVGNTDSVLVIKGDAAFTTSNSFNTLLLPVDRIVSTIQKYSLFVQGGISLSSPVIISPPIGISSTTISTKQFLAGVSIPTTTPITISNGFVEICLPGSASSFGVSSISSIYLYSRQNSTDPWLLDSTVGNIIFTSSGQLCFTANHLTDFAVTKALPVITSSSSSGGGGGGGGSSASVGNCGDKKDNDQDGLIDSLDPDCHTDGKILNQKSYSKYKKENSVLKKPTTLFNINLSLLELLRQKLNQKNLVNKTPPQTPQCEIINYSPLNNFGNKNNSISKIQQKLFKLGFLSGTYNGYFGITTRDAIKKYQIQNRLGATGVLDVKTLTLLNLICN